MKKQICFVAWLVGSICAYGGTEFRAVAQRSEAAPGGGTYRDFDLSFSKPEGGFSSDGKVGLIAQTSDALGMSYLRWDQFAGPETGLVAVTRQFTEPPGMPGSTFRLPNGPPIVNLHGDVCIFQEVDVGGSFVDGIWAGTPGALVMVAVEGEQVPGMAAGVTFTDVDSARVFNDQGRVAFRGTMAGPGITSGVDNVGIWEGTPGAITLAARANDPVDDMPGHVWAILGPPKLNDQDELCFVAEVSGPGVNASNDQGIWVGPKGSLQRGLQEGEPAQTMPLGVTINGFSIFTPLSFAKDRQFAYRTTLSGPGITNGVNDEVHIAGVLGSNHTVFAQAGTLAPGIPNGVRFSSALTTHAAICDAGIVALFMELDTSHPDVTVDNFSTLYHGLPGALQLVAREGDEVPGHPGHSFGQFYLFTTLGLNREGWAVVENNDVHIVQPDGTMKVSFVGGSANNPMIDIGGGVMTQALGVKLVEQRLLTAGNDGNGMQISDKDQVLVQFSYNSPTSNNPGIFLVECKPDGIRIEALSVSGNNATIDFTSSAGAAYVVQTNGTFAGWGDLDTNVVGQGVNTIYTHTNGANAAVQHYRVVQP